VLLPPPVVALLTDAICFWMSDAAAEAAVVAAVTAAATALVAAAEND